MEDRIKVKIHYEDTDAGGVVYYANYLKYLERGRTDFLASRGIDVYEHHARGCFFVVVSVDIRYRRSARLGEVIEVTTGIGEARNASLVFTHGVYRGDELLAEATVTLAYADSAGKPRRLPAPIRELGEAVGKGGMR